MACSLVSFRLNIRYDVSLTDLGFEKNFSNVRANTTVFANQILLGERGGSVVECRTPEREVRGSRPTAAVLCPWARHFTPRKYWLITQEAMAPSRHDWKIVDWDVKPQHNQPNIVALAFWASIEIEKSTECQNTILRKWRIRIEQPINHVSSILEIWSWWDRIFAMGHSRFEPTSTL